MFSCRAGNVDRFASRSSCRTSCRRVSLQKGLASERAVHTCFASHGFVRPEVVGNDLESLAMGFQKFALSWTILLTLLVAAYAKISESTIERDGRGIILLAEPFGFGAGGYLDLTVSNLESHRSNVDFSLLGFFITSSQVSQTVRSKPELCCSCVHRFWQQLISPHKQSQRCRLTCLLVQMSATEHDLCLPYSSPYQDDFLLQAEAQLELDLAQGTCALQAETVTKLLTLKQVEDNSKAGDNTTILSDTMANLVPGYTGGEWSLFFANCQKPSVVSYNLNVAMYNMHNGQRDYLSVGEDMIPSVYLVSLLPLALASTKSPC